MKIQSPEDATPLWQNVHRDIEENLLEQRLLISLAYNVFLFYLGLPKLKIIILHLELQQTVLLGVDIIISSNINNYFYFPHVAFAKHIIEVTRLAAKQKYSVFCDWIGPKPLIFIQKPADVQASFSTN